MQAVSLLAAVLLAFVAVFDMIPCWLWTTPLQAAYVWSRFKLRSQQGIDQPSTVAELSPFPENAAITLYRINDRKISQSFISETKSSHGPRGFFRIRRSQVSKEGQDDELE